MDKKHLDEVLPFLRTIDKGRREQFYTYFQNAPTWILENLIIENMEKGRTFIQEGAPADTIYFIGDGIIKATEYRVYGISFDFMLFTKVYAYGGMEVTMELEQYRTSLQTVTDCIVVKIPRVLFSRWMHTDIKSLAYESKLMAEYLLEQARGVRAFLFLQGADRLTMLLINRYEKYARNGILKLNNDRKELSDFTGLSAKTITRAVNKLKEDGELTKEGRYIIVNGEQYVLLKNKLAEILDDE